MDVLLIVNTIVNAIDMNYPLEGYLSWTQAKFIKQNRLCWIKIENGNVVNFIVYLNVVSVSSGFQRTSAILSMYFHMLSCTVFLDKIETTKFFF